MRKLLILCVALAFIASACGPPSALKRMVGRDAADEQEAEAAPEAGSEAFPAPEAGSEAFPAPRTPSAPAQLLFGTVILSNEPGWGIFFNRGQVTLGALVLDVLPDTPAAQLGLKAGDVITSIDGQTTTNHEQLLVAFRDSETTEHTMKVKRVDGTILDIEAKLVPPAGFSLIGYLEGKAAANPDPVARYLLAEQVEDNNRAIEIIKGVINEHPNFAEGHALLARRLLDKVEASTGATAAEGAPADVQEMTRAIDRAVELDPEAAGIYRARSQINLSLDNGDKAEADASKALEIDEASAEANYLLGTARLTLAKYGQAIERLYQAVEINPYEPKYYVNLALGYRSLGREDDAQATFDAAKSLIQDPATLQRLDEMAASGG